MQQFGARNRLQVPQGFHQRFHIVTVGGTKIAETQTLEQITPAQQETFDTISDITNPQGNLIGNFSF